MDVDFLRQFVNEFECPVSLLELLEREDRARRSDYDDFLLDFILEALALVYVVDLGVVDLQLGLGSRTVEDQTFVENVETANLKALVFLVVLAVCFINEVVVTGHVEQLQGIRLHCLKILRGFRSIRSLCVFMLIYSVRNSRF